MPLDTITLKNSIKSAYLANLPVPDMTQIAQVDAMSTAIADAIRIFVEGATVTNTAGLIAPGGGGPVTGVFGNTIT